MSCKWSLLSTTVLVLLALASGCADADGASPPTVASVDAPEPLTTDAGARPVDAAPEPVTTCCRLDNDRGERLDYKCGATGTAISADWFEERGYRCWLVQ